LPELPEVEAIRRVLRQSTGERVSNVYANDPEVYGANFSPALARNKLAGQRIREVLRLGKYLILEMEEGSLIYSLRMTGKALLMPFRDCPVDSKYVKLRLELEDEDREVILTSVRRLSRLYWYTGEDLRDQPNLSRLGPDPLETEFTWKQFSLRFNNRTAPIKTLLMDQSFIAGIGNIYANELCFHAGIRPRRPADQLSETERKSIYDCIPGLMTEAIEKGGSSFTNFIGGDGKAGTFHLEHKVYDREGEDCFQCGTPIRKITLSNRSTYFCPECEV